MNFQRDEAFEKKLLQQLREVSSLSEIEQKQLSDQISHYTCLAYESCAEGYVQHHLKLSDLQKGCMDDLYQKVRDVFPDDVLHIADVGAGHAAKLAHLFKKPKTKCVALDNVLSFQSFLPEGLNFQQGDMRDLPLENVSQHLVLHQATFHHLPLLPSSVLGVNLALKEAVRVLKPAGFLSVVMKYGDDAFFDKTGRFFQPYNEGNFQKWVEGNNLNVVEIRKFEDQKAVKEWQDWLYVLLVKQ